jgi:peptidoglycan/LPS O-acetylase OafA/YrhL
MAALLPASVAVWRAMGEQDRFPLIDALRAIAAIAVLGTHAAFFAGAEYDGSPLGHYTQRLEVGVSVFFVISGFLLYRPFLVARFERAGRPRTGAYAWRRFLRIVPAYWVALTLSTWWIGHHGVWSASGIPTYYGLAQTYRESTIAGGITQAWTLTIEIAFYACLPLFALAMSRIPARDDRTLVRSEALGLLALVVVSAIWKVAVLLAGNHHQIEVTPLLIALPAYLDQFAIGMGLALLTVWLPRRDHASRPVELLDRAPWLPWVGAAVAFWAVSTQIGIGNRLFEPMSVSQYLERHYLYAAIAAGLVLPAVLGTSDRGWVRHLLGWRLLAWLGLVSYGIYLWHSTVFALLAKWGLGDLLNAGAESYLLWPLAGLGGAVVLAAASWYLIERPALSLKRLVRQRPRDDQAISAGTLAEAAAEAVHPHTIGASPVAAAENAK